MVNMLDTEVLIRWIIIAFHRSNEGCIVAILRRILLYPGGMSLTEPVGNSELLSAVTEFWTALHQIHCERGHRRFRCALPLSSAGRSSAGEPCYDRDQWDCFQGTVLEVEGGKTEIRREDHQGRSTRKFFLASSCCQGDFAPIIVKNKMTVGDNWIWIRTFLIFHNWTAPSSSRCTCWSVFDNHVLQRTKIRSACRHQCTFVHVIAIDARYINSFPSVMCLLSSCA